MARGGAGIAQVGDGVLAGPGFRRMPPCKFKLSTSAAAKEYGIVTRKLFEAGRLTEAKHIAASMYAKIHDQIALAEAEKRPLRAAWMKEMRDQMRILDLDGSDAPIAAPVEAPGNKFARRGLPNRR